MATETETVLQFLAAPAVTALITVSIGGLMGQLVTAAIQKGQRSEQVVSGWVEAKGKLAITAEHEYLDHSTAVLDSAFALLGNALAATDNVAILSEPRYRTGRENSAGDNARLQEQHRMARAAFNATNDRWNADRERVALRLDYYYGSRTDSVYVVWRALVVATDQYGDAVADLYWNSYAGDREQRAIEVRLISDN